MPATLKLPFTLTVKAVAQTPGAVHVTADIRDAEGSSVQSLPFVASRDTTGAQLEAILVSQIRQIAETYHRRGLAEPADKLEGEDRDADLAALVGRTFTGSVWS